VEALDTLMANTRRPSTRTAKSKSAAENRGEDSRQAVARKNPRASALGQTPVKMAKALRKK
jgi:hypothetical protein